MRNLRLRAATPLNPLPRGWRFAYVSKLTRSAIKRILFLRQAKRTSENACPFCLMHYVRGIRTRALRKRHGASFLAAARKRREKQALAFAKIERSGHSQQPDTKCQMQGISAKARLLSVDRRLLRVITLLHH
nr:MAG TPA: hypothetical protein [Caudoviricetes sp.]